MNSISTPISKPKTVPITPSIKSDILSNANRSKIPNIAGKEETPHFADSSSNDAFDMDFSVLDDHVNQFEANAKVESPLKVVPATKSKSPVPAVDNFADILSNWDNICKMDDAIEEEMSSTIIDEPDINNDVSLAVLNYIYQSFGHIFFFNIYRLY